MKYVANYTNMELLQLTTEWIYSRAFKSELYGHFQELHHAKNFQIITTLERTVWL